MVSGKENVSILVLSPISTFELHSAIFHSASASIAASIAPMRDKMSEMWSKCHDDLARPEQLFGKISLMFSTDMDGNLDVGNRKSTLLET